VHLVARSIAIAVVGLLVGACQPIESTSSGSPGSAPMLSPAPRASAIESPGPTATPGGTWRSLELLPSEPATGWIGLVQAVAPIGGGFVAVGSPVCTPLEAPSECQLSAWTIGPSETTWVRAPEQPGLRVTFDEDHSEPWGLFDVALGPAGLIAIGHVSFGWLTTAWRSADGRTWQALDVDFDGIDVSAIAGSPTGYVVVGTKVGPGVSGRAAAWFSADGTSWAPAVDNSAMDIGPCASTLEKPACGGMRAVTAVSGGFIAVGHVRTGTDPASISPAVWETTDGTAWRQRATGLDVGGALVAVAARGPHVVAAGVECRPDCRDGRSRGLLVTSATGGAWEIVRLPAAEPLVAAAAGGDRLAVLGSTDSQADRPVLLQVWVLDDAGAWVALDGPPTGPEIRAFRPVDLQVGANGEIVIAGSAETDASPPRVNLAFAITCSSC